MTLQSDLSAMYARSRLVLWVEDEETRTYLNTAWQDGDIGILIAGGNENIHAVAESAYRDRHTWVLGLRDRDFSCSNRARWNDPNVRVIVLDAFELENLLLDPAAMAGCDVNTSGKDRAAIQADLQALATPLAWWMSCRRTIVDLRDATTSSFTAHPKRSRVASQQEAESAIFSSSWWTATLPAIGTTITQPWVTQKLQTYHAAYTNDLASGAWQQSFSGKEILGEMRSRIWTRNQQPDPGGRLRLVRSVAEQQRTTNTLPQEIIDLHAALRARI